MINALIAFLYKNFTSNILLTSTANLIGLKIRVTRTGVLVSILVLTLILSWWNPKFTNLIHLSVVLQQQTKMKKLFKVTCHAWELQQLLCAGNSEITLTFTSIGFTLQCPTKCLWSFQLLQKFTLYHVDTSCQMICRNSVMSAYEILKAAITENCINVK